MYQHFRQPGVTRADRILSAHTPRHCRSSPTFLLRISVVVACYCSLLKTAVGFGASVSFLPPTSLRPQQFSPLVNSNKANEFLKNDFGRHVVHFENNKKLNDLQLPCFDSEGQFDMQVLFDTTNYIQLRKRGSFDYLDKNETSFEQFCDYIQEGGSAVIPVAEDNALMGFRNEIERSLDSKVSINIYHSGPNAVALNRHYDKYDVFVMQLDGQKEWEVGLLRTDASMKDEYSIDNAHWTNNTLTPGDILYIPKGIYHAATTANGYNSTTHITIGLESWD